jgi:hypothetical protein
VPNVDFITAALPSDAGFGELRMVSRRAIRLGMARG